MIVDILEIAAAKVAEDMDSLKCPDARIRANDIRVTLDRLIKLQMANDHTRGLVDV